jgi:hypothetical protein
MDRGRLTITNVVYMLLALVALAALWPVFAEQLSAASPLLLDEEELVFSTMLPLAVLVMLGVIYIEARTGLR